MDDSQSSDVFSENGDYSFVSPAISTDNISYESLVSDTKTSLSKNIQKEIGKSSFKSYFTPLLEDCGACISQSLDLITGILCDTDFQLFQLCEYLDNAVNILQMLSNFLTTVVESISMSCHDMRTFPTTTGRIVMTVFSHCKDSESLYGNNLRSVEKQLKDLFRNCHELQLTYLMILEKHFIFDLSENDELNVLVEALNINLKIGEVVQALDVKTMAEQWKAYIAICEKHATCLTDTCVYRNCTLTLQHIIESHITTAVQEGQEERIILRSLKVANFTIKILLKICQMFKHASDKNYKHIVELLLTIYLNNPAYLESIGNKSPQFTNLLKTNVGIPSDVLLKELVMDAQFIQYVRQYGIDELKRDDKLLGYILMLVSAIRLILSEKTFKSKNKIFECIFKWLPYGHIWFNMGLKFQTNTHNEQTYGLYEHVLVHSYALVSTFTSEEVNMAEQTMLEAVISTDCYGALFSSNLWELLSRSSPKQFTLNQLQSLCRIYQQLELNPTFHSSPQSIHLSFTISQLFKTLKNEDKYLIYKSFNVNNENHVRLWTALKIENLPEALQRDAEEFIFKNLRNLLHRICVDGVPTLEEVNITAKTMKLAATSSFNNIIPDIEDYVVGAWMRLCPNKNTTYLQMNPRLEEYFDALVTLLMAYSKNFSDNLNATKVAHVLCGAVEKGTPDVKLALIRFTCHYCFLQGNFENDFTKSYPVRTLKYLLQDSDNIVRSKTFKEVKKLRSISDSFNDMMTEVLNDDASLNRNWKEMEKRTRIKESIRLHLAAVTDFRYNHKCVQIQDFVELSNSAPLTKKNSSNFDFADIDTLFNEGDAEPACKRVKLDKSDIEIIIARIENDVQFLCEDKENVFTSEFRNRIKAVCDKLKNIRD